MDAFDRLEKTLDATTQEKFSKRTGVPQSQLSMLRRRMRRPSLQHVPALNRELGTTLEDWLGAKLDRPKARPKPKKRGGSRRAA